jgi:hypothetical protein
VLTLGGGIVFTPIATALTVVALRRTPETLVDFGALLVGAAAVAFYTLMFVWTVGLVLYEVLLSADAGGCERISPAPACSPPTAFLRLAFAE